MDISCPSVVVDEHAGKKHAVIEMWRKLTVRPRILGHIQDPNVRSRGAHLRKDLRVRARERLERWMQVVRCQSVTCCVRCSVQVGGILERTRCLIAPKFRCGSEVLWRAKLIRIATSFAPRKRVLRRYYS